MKFKLTFSLSLGILLSAIPVLGHHSFAREYDGSKPITLKGSVTMLDFVNPHSWLYIDIKDAKGTTVSWGIELGPMHDLKLQGWSKITLKPGTKVAIEGFPAKNGSNTANARTVNLSDGQTLFTAGSAMSPQTKK